MLLCLLALLAIGVTPFWLVALVVARDAGIVGGWLLFKLLGLPVAASPLFLGKASTDAGAVHLHRAAVAGLDLDATPGAGCELGLRAVHLPVGGGVWRRLFARTFRGKADGVVRAA